MTSQHRPRVRVLYVCHPTQGTRSSGCQAHLKVVAEAHLQGLVGQLEAVLVKVNLDSNNQSQINILLIIKKVFKKKK